MSTPAKPRTAKTERHSIAKITHSDPEGRSGNLSDDRRTVERVMRVARKGLSLSDFPQVGNAGAKLETTAAPK